MSPLTSNTSSPSRPNPFRSLLILGLAALAFALAQTTLIPALVDMIEAFNTDAAGIAWVLTGYLIAAAVFTPIFGRLGDMFGKRKFLVIALLLFAAGSVVSALGTSLEVVVIGRVLQGAGGGIFPLCFGIIRDEFPPEKVSQSIGLISATAGIGGGLGLILGGVILDASSYHWIFWLGAAMAVIASITTVIFVPESPNRSPGRIDIRGAFVLAVGLSIPLYAISKAAAWGWLDSRLIGLVLVGLVILAFWNWLQLRTEEPLADIRTLAEPAIAMTNLTTLLVGFGMFGSFILIPQLVEAPELTGYGFGFSATQAGLVMLPAAVVMLFAGPASGLLGQRFGNKLPLALGGFISGFGLLGLGFFHDTVIAIICWNVVSSVGIGLGFAAMPNLIMQAVPVEQTGEATGFNALIRSVGSSLGSQVTASILTGTIVAGAVLPTGHGFKVAFLVCAGISLLAGLVATFIPDPGRSDSTIAEDLGAASVLGEPALAEE